MMQQHGNAHFEDGVLPMFTNNQNILCSSSNTKGRLCDAFFRGLIVCSTPAKRLFAARWGSTAGLDLIALSSTCAVLKMKTTFLPCGTVGASVGSIASSCDGAFGGSSSSRGVSGGSPSSGSDGASGGNYSSGGASGGNYSSGGASGDSSSSDGASIANPQNTTPSVVGAIVAHALLLSVNIRRIASQKSGMKAAAAGAEIRLALADSFGCGYLDRLIVEW
jgi:hypothetical protein